jgi:hypothetical protein
LHVAAAAGHEAAVRLLLGRGARLDIEDYAKKLPSEYVPPENDALFDLMERMRLGETRPVIEQAPTIAQHRAGKAKDAYGEDPSLWDRPSAGPRNRLG